MYLGVRAPCRESNGKGSDRHGARNFLARAVSDDLARAPLLRHQARPPAATMPARYAPSSPAPCSPPPVRLRLMTCRLLLGGVPLRLLGQLPGRDRHATVESGSPQQGLQVAGQEGFLQGTRFVSDPGGLPAGCRRGNARERPVAWCLRRPPVPSCAMAGSPVSCAEQGAPSLSAGAQDDRVTRSRSSAPRIGTVGCGRASARSDHP
jgi:hypothetical protein